MISWNGWHYPILKSPSALLIMADHILNTSGNGNLKDVIYQIFGREITSNLLEVHFSAPNIQIEGFIGKPLISRGNRNFENYFINGRFIKSMIINKPLKKVIKTS